MVIINNKILLIYIVVVLCLFSFGVTLADYSIPVVTYDYFVENYYSQTISQGSGIPQTPVLSLSYSVGASYYYNGVITGTVSSGANVEECADVIFKTYNNGSTSGSDVYNPSQNYVFNSGVTIIGGRYTGWPCHTIRNIPQVPLDWGTCGYWEHSGYATQGNARTLVANFDPAAYNASGLAGFTDCRVLSTDSYTKVFTCVRTLNNASGDCLQLTTNNGDVYWRRSSDNLSCSRDTYPNSQCHHSPAYESCQRMSDEERRETFPGYTSCDQLDYADYNHCINHVWCNCDSTMCDAETIQTFNSGKSFCFRTTSYPITAPSVCNATSSYAQPTQPCLKGFAVSNMTPNADNMGWSWTCTKNCGEVKTFDCSALRKIDGNCGLSSEGYASGVATSAMPSGNLCKAGTPSTVAGGVNSTNKYWQWSCDGINGGNNATCYAPLLGKCGPVVTSGTTSAPMSNRCEVGTASSVSGAGPWTWTCTGWAKSGLTPAQTTSPVTCTAPLNGECNPASTGARTTPPNSPTERLCNHGTLSNFSGNVSTGPWTWTCVGSTGGSTATCNAVLIGPPTATNLSNTHNYCGGSNYENLSWKYTDTNIPVSPQGGYDLQISENTLFTSNVVNIDHTNNPTPPQNTPAEKARTSYQAPVILVPGGTGILNSGTTYYWRVKVHNSKAQSDNSGWVTGLPFTTPPHPYPTINSIPSSPQNPYIKNQVTFTAVAEPGDESGTQSDLHYAWTDKDGNSVGTDSNVYRVTFDTMGSKTVNVEVCEEHGVNELCCSKSKTIYVRNKQPLPLWVEVNPL